MRGVRAFSPLRMLLVAALSAACFGAIASSASAAPIAELTPTSQDYGSVQIDTTSSAVAFTLVNTGDANMTITSITKGGGDAPQFGPLEVAGCESSPGTFLELGPGDACDVELQFAPTTTGNKSASITAVTDGGTVVSNVTGTGVAPIASVNPPSIDYGTVTVGSNSFAQQATLTNTGDAPLTVSAIVKGGANTAQFSALDVASCESSPGNFVTLQIAESCSVTAVFTPISVGNFSASIDFFTDGGDVSTLLTGQGLATAISGSPSSLDFGAQAVSATPITKTVTVTNDSVVPVSVSQPAVSGTGSNLLSVPQHNVGVASPPSNGQACGGFLYIGYYCTVDVTFTPATVGTVAATVTVAASGGNTLEIPISATVTATPSPTPTPVTCPTVKASLAKPGGPRGTTRVPGKPTKGVRLMAEVSSDAALNVTGTATVKHGNKSLKVGLVGVEEMTVNGKRRFALVATGANAKKVSYGDKATVKASLQATSRKYASCKAQTSTSQTLLTKLAKIVTATAAS